MSDFGGLLNKITQGDCLIESEKIASGSVDLILTDPPYGNMDTDGGRRLGINGWDSAINPEDIFAVANRILRNNGKLVLFSQEPYTSQLITKAIPNLPFAYRMVWEKDTFANHLGSKKAPVNYHEDILVFSKTHPKHDYDGNHPLRRYFTKVRKYIGLPKKTIIDTVGQRADHVFRTDSTQFSLCTERTYAELIERYGIDRMDDFRDYDELKREDREYRQGLIKRMNDEYPAVFNLWEGGKYKSSILRYKKDYDGYHPTQKPVLLLQDLVKTFSNEGDIVVDLTAGSASTCVAAIKTNRQFIGIEKESEYVEIGNRRIAEALAKKEASE